MRFVNLTNNQSRPIINTMKKITYDLPPQITIKENCIYLDIETTGLSKKRDRIYLIGLAKCSGITQFFAESLDEESLILQELLSSIEGCDAIYTYNGTSFDLPFLNTRLKANNLPSMPDIKHTDLYISARNLKPVLRSDSIKQRDIEKIMGIESEDTSDGAMTVKDYFMYLAVKDEDALKRILLHNYCDLTGLTALTDITVYDDFFKDPIPYIDTIDVTRDEALSIHAMLKIQVKPDICFESPDYSYAIKDHSLDITYRLSDNKGKLYYPNYKDYYYLPVEGYAIHKSIATYVDKNFRQKADLSNCFTLFDAGLIDNNNTKSTYPLIKNAIQHSYVSLKNKKEL